MSLRSTATERVLVRTLRVVGRSANVSGESDPDSSDWQQAARWLLLNVIVPTINPVSENFWDEQIDRLGVPAVQRMADQERHQAEGEASFDRKDRQNAAAERLDRQRRAGEVIA